MTAAFSPVSATGTTSTLTLTASAAAATGPATVTVTGTGGGLSRTTTVALTVNGTATPNFALSASPASLSINQGASGTSTIGITRSGGFTAAVAFERQRVAGRCDRDVQSCVCRGPDQHADVDGVERGSHRSGDRHRHRHRRRPHTHGLAERDGERVQAPAPEA